LKIEKHIVCYETKNDVVGLRRHQLSTNVLTIVTKYT